MVPDMTAEEGAFLTAEFIKETSRRCKERRAEKTDREVKAATDQSRRQNLVYGTPTTQALNQLQYYSNVIVASQPLHHTFLPQPQYTPGQPFAPAHTTIQGHPINYNIQPAGNMWSSKIDKVSTTQQVYPFTEDTSQHPTTGHGSIAFKPASYKDMSGQTQPLTFQSRPMTVTEGDWSKYESTLSHMRFPTHLSPCSQAVDPGTPGSSWDEQYQDQATSAGVSSLPPRIKTQFPRILLKYDASSPKKTLEILRSIIEMEETGTFYDDRYATSSQRSVRLAELKSEERTLLDAIAAGLISLDEEVKPTNELTAGKVTSPGLEEMNLKNLIKAQEERISTLEAQLANSDDVSEKKCPLHEFPEVTSKFEESEREVESEADGWGGTSYYEDDRWGGPELSSPVDAGNVRDATANESTTNDRIQALEYRLANIESPWGPVIGHVNYGYHAVQFEDRVQALQDRLSNVEDGSGTESFCKGFTACLTNDMSSQKDRLTYLENTVGEHASDLITQADIGQSLNNKLNVQECIISDLLSKNAQSDYKIRQIEGRLLGKEMSDQNLLQSVEERNKEFQELKPLIYGMASTIYDKKPTQVEPKVIYKHGRPHYVDSVEDGATANSNLTSFNPYTGLRSGWKWSRGVQATIEPTANTINGALGLLPVSNLAASMYEPSEGPYSVENGHTDHWGGRLSGEPSRRAFSTMQPTAQAVNDQVCPYSCSFNQGHSAGNGWEEDDCWSAPKQPAQPGYLNGCGVNVMNDNYSSSRIPTQSYRGRGLSSW